MKNRWQCAVDRAHIALPHQQFAEKVEGDNQPQSMRFENTYQLDVQSLPATKKFGESVSSPLPLHAHFLTRSKCARWPCAPHLSGPCPEMGSGTSCSLFSPSSFTVSSSEKSSSPSPGRGPMPPSSDPSRMSVLCSKRTCVLPFCPFTPPQTAHQKLTIGRS